MLKLCFILLFVTFIQCEKLTRDEGYGKHYILDAVKDVWLEGWGNKDRRSIHQFIVGRLRYYPLKRSLIQFENIPKSCPSNKIIWARMQLYFVAAHRASFRSVNVQPWVDYTIHIHRVKKSWNERRATTFYRDYRKFWSRPYLRLGVDAEARPERNPTTIYSREPRYQFKGFDVTNAAKAWANGAPNNGLLIKVKRENIYGRGLRFYDRHHPNVKVRPYLQVLCKN